MTFLHNAYTVNRSYFKKVNKNCTTFYLMLKLVKTDSETQVKRSTWLIKAQERETSSISFPSSTSSSLTFSDLTTVTPLSISTFLTCSSNKYQIRGRKTDYNFDRKNNHSKITFNHRIKTLKP
ncbi:hypothetical protein Hanom_Chr12g01133961 [Helianthus anomalus]